MFEDTKFAAEIKKVMKDARRRNLRTNAKHAMVNTATVVALGYIVASYFSTTNKISELRKQVIATI